MNWLNEPKQWSQDGNTLTMTADGQTDFWRIPGKINHNGHFIYQEVTGDFTATVRFRGGYAARYDQAGLMLRESETVWLKAGIELETQGLLASVVLTREFSDWGVVLLSGDDLGWTTFAVKRSGAMIEVSYALQRTDDLILMRQGYFTPKPIIQVGMMVAAPEGNGFEATFAGFTVTAG
jgi:uncharacterized protein